MTRMIAATCLVADAGSYSNELVAIRQTGLPNGHFVARSRTFMAASDKVRITVQGKSGHAVRPHFCIDASLVASAIVRGLQSVFSRNVTPADTAVSVGNLAAGEIYNVIPEVAQIKLSVRAFDPQVRNQSKERIIALAQWQTASHGAQARLGCLTSHPVLMNEADQTAFALQVVRELVGEERECDDVPQIMSSENFGFMPQARRGSMIRLGNGTLSATLHNPSYDFNDANTPLARHSGRALKSAIYLFKKTKQETRNEIST